LAALRKAVTALDARGIARSRVAEVLLAELGVTPVSLPSRSNGGSTGGVPREQFLAALAGLTSENPRNPLLLLRELRARAGMSKQEFDATALLLKREGVVILHHHDHAASLPKRERDELVQDGSGIHYVGIALRGGP
jgi:hypothetical protein